MRAGKRKAGSFPFIGDLRQGDDRVADGGKGVPPTFVLDPHPERPEFLFQDPTVGDESHPQVVIEFSFGLLKHILCRLPVDRN